MRRATMQHRRSHTLFSPALCGSDDPVSLVHFGPHGIDCSAKGLMDYPKFRQTGGVAAGH
jgi:hypothetical protein